MFKFDFVQDSDDERTQIVQNVRNEVIEPALTEVSLIELVRAPRLRLQGVLTFIPSTVRQLALPHIILSAADTIIGGRSRALSLSAGSL